MPIFREIFPVFYTQLPQSLVGDFAAGFAAGYSSATYLEKIAEKVDSFNLSAGFIDLARGEYALYRLSDEISTSDVELTETIINPDLHLLKSDWGGLPALIKGEGLIGDIKAVSTAEFILVYRHPLTHEKIVRVATESDLLALKMIAEELAPETIMAAGSATSGVIDQVMADGVHNGILLQPQTKIKRSPARIFSRSKDRAKEFVSSSFFTLQWHITQECDLHCRHCYDRSSRSPLPLSKGLRILDDLYAFCQTHFIKGQVSFSGGNPLLYPDFTALYRAAVERGLQVAILGNPTDQKVLAELTALKAPVFYQISLEGLSEHNDYMRGSGHFRRSLEFLDLLKNAGIFSMVMLTLTRANLDQVLPLTEILQGHVDLFTFNRLAMVGEGAGLYSVEPEKYRQFLPKYMAAAEKSSFIALKDNLFNIIKQEQGQSWFGGCAGYGCGAAFNFMALLPDGEVHACRKLPSLLGNIFSSDFERIYHSELAERYRQGAESCRDCEIRPVCGGCPAVTYGFDLDIFADKDPYCFLTQPHRTDC